MLYITPEEMQEVHQAIIQVADYWELLPHHKNLD